MLPGDGEKYAAFEGKLFETSVGRLLWNSILPSDFPYLNVEITGVEIRALVEDLLERYGHEATPDILDKIKQFGYRYATRSGITWSMSDIVVPKEKNAIVEAAREETRKLSQNFEDGLLSDEERYRLFIEIWSAVKD